jgi:hypothetical protein
MTTVDFITALFFACTWGLAKHPCATSFRLTGRYFQKILWESAPLCLLLPNLKTKPTGQAQGECSVQAGSICQELSSSQSSCGNS